MICSFGQYLRPLQIVVQMKEVVLLPSLETLEKALRKNFGFHLAFAVGYLILLFPTLDLSDTERAAVLLGYVLMTMYPTFTAVCGFLFGLRRGFSWLFLLFPLFWFLVATSVRFGGIVVDLFSFCLIDLIAALAGCFVGNLFKRHQDEMYL